MARLSELLGKAAGEDEDALYLAGLMHDIGKTVLVDFLVKEASTIEEELAQLGTDHTTIGELVLSKWSVANHITDAVRSHHSNSKDKFKAVLYFANRIALEEEYTYAVEDASMALGISYDDILDIISPILESENKEEGDDETAKETP